MSTQRRTTIPAATGEARWRTVATVRTVLVIVHSVTALNRFDDILSVFDADRRIQLLFTFPDAAVISSDVEGDLARRGALIISWPEAITGEFDLALSAHHSGELYRVRAPLAVLSHGLGYTKYSHRRAGEPESRRAGEPESRRAGEPESRRAGEPETYGLSAPWLLHEGKVVPSAVVLSHTEQYARLSETVPQALSAAIVAGDPCYDRMVASTHRRNRYRRALGVHDQQTLVTISSTWGPKSLFGSNRDLISTLTAELDLDGHAVAVILHPNTWFAHGPAQIRLWLADCLRAGVRLIPATRGWQQTIIASDVVIGDHGAVSGYSAAVGRPTLLAAFPAEDVVARSAMGALGRAAARLDYNGSFQTQIDAAAQQPQYKQFAEVLELTTSAADQAGALLRTAFYGLIGLSEPHQPVPIPQYEELELRPEHIAVSAWWATTSTDTDGSVLIHRWPADVIGRPTQPPETLGRHLVVSIDHPRRDLLGNAGICVLEDSAGVPVHRVFHERPACDLVVVRDETGACIVHHRGGGVLRAAWGAAQHDSMDATIACSAIYHWLTENTWSSLPGTLPVRIGAGRRRARIELSTAQ